jgi:undecaprenyl-diphosphatase
MNQHFFLVLNQGIVSPFFDRLMPLASLSAHPLVLWLAALTFLYFRKKDATLFMGEIRGFTLALLVSIVASETLKFVFNTPRPAAVLESVRVLGKPLLKHGLPSGHATRAFAITGWLFKRSLPKWAIIALAWAALVCISRVYIGAHFPSDVAGGAILGLACGIGAAIFWDKKTQPVTPA